MHQKFTTLLLTFSLALTSCGQLVEVDTSEIGKIQTEEGLQDGFKHPSTFRLPFSLLTEPSLIVVQASDHAIKESFTLFMPLDQLTLSFDVRGVFSVGNDPARLEPVFTNLVPGGRDGSKKTISFSSVYTTYAQPVVRNGAREVLAKYTIQEVLVNREAINRELEDLILKRLRATPITVKPGLGLAEVNPPPVIVNANEAAKKREIEIEEANADRLVKMAQAEAALEIAQKQQEIDLLEAETQVLVNQKLAEGVSDAFVTQRALKALETLASSDNKVFLLPMEALSNPAIMTGLNMKAMED